MTDEGSMIITRFSFDNEIFTFERMLDFLQTKAPPDDASLIFNDALAVFMKRIQEDGMLPVFLSSDMILVVFPYVMKTVGMVRDVKMLALCRKLRGSSLLAGNLRSFAVSMSMGLSDEVDQYLERETRLIKDYFVVVIDDKS